ncbi:hypothetical protein MMC30_003777 [Trapelia coarctata]|nr:hypothetical protein [Trapelia coarctata]
MPPIKGRYKYEVPYRSQSLQHSKFDPGSGLAYTEVAFRSTPMCADWVWKTRGMTTEIAMYRSPGPGCSTLRNMAIRKACLSMTDLIPDSFEGVEWQIGQQLWSRIVAQEIDSLYAWKVFAAAYPREGDKSLRRRYQIIRKPNMALGDYIKPLVSLSFQWIAFLTLSNITCSRHDLINVSKLTNIGALTIGHGVEAPDVGLEDSVVRAWGRAATENGAFSRLRVFACRAQRAITSQVFDYLSQFPSLTMFVVEDCNIGSQDKPYAKAQGFKYRSGKDLSEFLVSGGATNSSWDSVLHAYFQLGSGLRDAIPNGDSVEGGNIPHVLHFSLGGAPPDAEVDSVGSRSMRCFYRCKSHSEGRQHLPTTEKRPPTNPHPSQPLSKKIAMKISSGRDPVDLMMEFWF